MAAADLHTDNVRRIRATSAELFTQLRDPAGSRQQRAAARDALVRLHLGLVEHLARRFTHRGEPLEDLLQVGTIGLIKAVDRFDPDRAVEFSTYAAPTIVGEIKRHFRDKGWTVRPPRRIQELQAAVTAATADLAQDLGRSPTVAELAGRLDVTEEHVLEALEAGSAYTPVSLDAPASVSDAGACVGDTLGADDSDLAHVELRETVRPLLAALPDRERRIVTLRFFRGMTQSQIAAEVGVSQMHVSRLLRRSLARLREVAQVPS